MEKGGRNAKKSSSSSSSSSKSITIDEFVSKMTPLLDIEKVYLFFLMFFLSILARYPFIDYYTLLNITVFMSLWYPIGLVIDKNNYFEFLKQNQELYELDQEITPLVCLCYLHCYFYAFNSDDVKEAEISASMNTGATRNLDTAQKRGSTMLNLKCVDAQVRCFFVFLTHFSSNLFKWFWCSFVI